MLELKPHQLANANGLLEAFRLHGRGGDFSDTGTGKTLTYLHLCKMLGAQPAIVTRLSLIRQWNDACRLIGVEPKFIVNYDRLRSKTFPYISWTEKVSKRRQPDGSIREKIKRDCVWASDLGRVIFAFDEAQACRSETSLQSKTLIRAQDKYKTAIITATPFQTPLEAFPIGMTLKMFSSRDYYYWLHEHKCKKDFFGHMRFYGNHETMMEIGKELVAEKKVVRTTRDEIPGFPQTEVSVLPVTVGDPGEVQQVYLRLLEESRALDLVRAQEKVPEELQEFAAEIADVLPITKLIRLRQEAELHKAGNLAELAFDARCKGDKVAVFVNFDATIEILMKLLGTDCVVRGTRGGDNAQRWRAVQDFQANKTDFIILNNQAGGAGLSLHDPLEKRPRTSLISPPWSAVCLKQILGRPQRLGGGYSTQKLVFAADTVEEQVMERVQANLNNLDALVDADLDVTKMQKENLVF
jgi:hypothetical protein